MQHVLIISLASRGKALWRPYVSVSSQAVEHWVSVRAGTADITTGSVDITVGTVDNTANTVDTTAVTADTMANTAVVTAGTVGSTAGTVDIIMPATFAKGLNVADHMIEILSWMY